MKDDKQIGQRLKKLRKEAGLTQISLAERLGISFQQLQKYERGINRLSVYRLQQLAEALKVPILSFFENELPELKHEVAEGFPDYESGRKFPVEVENEEERRLLLLFRTVRSLRLRKSLLELLNGLIEFQEGEESE